MSCIEINAEEIYDIYNPVYIDVRSTEEWLEGNIPGSVNIPIFNDNERAEIGKSYKHSSAKAATDLGLEIAAPKIPWITKKIQAEADGRSIIIYCWRGGMRSKSIATILDLLGIKVYRLREGYRGYRNLVVKKISEIKYQRSFIVLQGMTGVGKTLILERLQRDGYPVINFEQLSGHRGSIFGAVGLCSQNKQKQFEALFWERIKEIGETSYYIIEAESKRIGRVTLPDEVIEAKLAGVHILLDAPAEVRINRLHEEYVINSNRNNLKEDLKHPIDFLKKKIEPESYQKIVSSIENEEYYLAIQILVEEYYDPRYVYAFNQYEGQFHKINAEHLSQAITELKLFISHLNV